MKERLKYLLIKHYRAVILALLVGFVSAVPQFIDKSTRPDFQGVSMGVVKDTGLYMARVKDVMDGHSYLTNPYLYEHKDGAPMQFWIPDYILAKPIQWLNLSIPTGFILWTFILTAFLTFLSYLILFALTKSERWSILGTALLHFGLFAVRFLRLPPPGLVFVFWLTTLLFLILFIQNKRNKFAVASAISFGLLFNMYPFYWTFYVVLFAVFIFLSLLFRLRDVPYKKFFLIFGGGLIVGLPYFISIWQSAKLPGYSETLARMGLIHTHFPSGIDSVAVASIVAIVFLILYRKKIVTVSVLNVFLFSGVLSAIIAVNQHLITGKNIEFSSHYMIGNMFWCAFVAVYLIVQWLQDKPQKVQRMVFWSIVIIVSVMSLRGAIGVIKQQAEYRPVETYVQTYAPVFDWLNNNAKKDDVAYADDQLSEYLAIYTSLNVYFSGGSILSFMTNDEVRKRFIINHFFDDYTPDYIRLNQRQIFGEYYVDEYGHNLSKNKLKKIFGLPQTEYKMVPDSVVEDVRSLAQSIKKDGFEKQLKTFRVDYLIWDGNKDSDWKVNNLKFLTKAYSSRGIIIYKIN